MRRTRGPKDRTALGWDSEMCLNSGRCGQPLLLLLLLLEDVHSRAVQGINGFF